MAAEIIDAGRFDRQTTNDERKETLEQILADEKRNRIAKNEARSPSATVLKGRKFAQSHLAVRAGSETSAERACRCRRGTG